MTEKAKDVRILAYTLQLTNFNRCFMFNYCQCCDARLWSSYTKNLGVCPECEEPDKPLQDLEDDLESIFNQPKVNYAHHLENE